MGNLCVSNNAVLTPTNLVVGGNLKLDNNSSVGTSGARTETYVGKDCVYGTSSTPSNVVGACGGYTDANLTANKRIWGKYLNGSGQYVNGVGATVPVLAIPAADFPTWYTNAMPGPSQACTAVSGSPPQFDNNTARDNSNPIQDLTPASSYTCRVGPAAATDSTTLSGAMTAAATTLTVASAAGFPTSGTYTIKVDNEYMVVTAGAGTTTWTVTRAPAGHGRDDAQLRRRSDAHRSGDRGALLERDDQGAHGERHDLHRRERPDHERRVEPVQRPGGHLPLRQPQLQREALRRRLGRDCDFAAWNPNTEMLTFVTERAGQGGVSAGNGIQFANNSSFQGALFANNGAVSFGNNSKSDGPIVASHIILSNNVSTDSFPNIVTVPVGNAGQPGGLRAAEPAAALQRLARSRR